MNQITPQGGTDALYERVRHLVPAMEWETFLADIRAIETLKRERNAVILAHNYQTPEIFHCVADIRGDSLALAREAQETDADVIVMAGVHFMAETAKMLNPHGTVLIPDRKAGCSLADSITGADVRALRARHPGVPVVTYVNTSAEVKAESDICCTSGNAKRVVESLGTDSVIMIPDEFLARNIGAETGIRMITWPGHCEVHERFTPEEIGRMRADNPGLVVLAHPECPPEVVAASDFSGSTAMMADFVRGHASDPILLVTECSMSDNLAIQYPRTAFVRPCNMCPHMKRITLSNIRHALETMTHEVTLDPELASRGRRAVERMLAI
ncbi:Quinolinate synthase A 2 [Gluconacetobacter sp. SXCC-1]|uniref:Quinolinate synthase n=1 Tax=Komagataeibacter rhaeticus TaxID=215221 RepID=A0A181C9L1_9PROT|nr:quinolinate synthase NadA [Komagataeibacter rhaeticus]ATU73160.1 quinolinate synthase NadA [Komagataeibacter xylinus]EGG76946.1 Quinolinate synthase A 2 [Gluconacetobacter sp. SXCC-1]MDT8871481.1 quinolinate synthase NadA [Komagataeibacter rhaeticus]QIP35098.1 quinolinate synthase NadA [Komagataeibacter rhaeticus]QOC47653.1 quinolinate synthase NadA [Komagataeibacter rhaeticus]